jgi:hypothetical protein
VKPVGVEVDKELNCKNDGEGGVGQAKEALERDIADGTLEG